MNETKKDELTKKAEEIVSKWKSEMEQQNMTKDPYKFYRLNCISMHEDMEEFWDLLCGGRYGIK